MNSERLEFIFKSLNRELEELRRLRLEYSDGEESIDNVNKIFDYDIAFLNEIKDEVIISND